MGITNRDLSLLIMLKEKGYISEGCSILEIGAQQCANSFLRADQELNKIATLFNTSDPRPLPFAGSAYIDSETGYEGLSEEAPASKMFWQWLGFTYKSVDIDGSHDSIFLDLNYDDVPKHEQGKYQIVTNFGTTEHVANQLNAFKIIHDLTAPGGIMMHHLPSQGMLNHGLVNYNPKFFWMLARSNGYHWVYIDYAGSLRPYDFPQNIMDHLSQFNEDMFERGKRYRIDDASLIVILQKAFNTPYVPPIDVNTGTKTTNKTLERRYWSVFQENPFEKYVEAKK